MANDAFHVAEKRQSFPMVTTTEEHAKAMMSGDESGAQGGSRDGLFESLDSGRANGFQRQLWRHVGCCKGLRGPSAGPSSSAGGTEAKRATASALSVACDALSVCSNALSASTFRNSCKFV